MTYRKGAIYQNATIGGAHPGFTDNMLQLPAIESDVFNGLQAGGIDVLDVRCPAPGLSNIAYAKIKPQGGGDAKQALAIMLTCSKQGLPKIAMVFDADVDIWDDERIAAVDGVPLHARPRHDHHSSVQHHVDRSEGRATSTSRSTAPRSAWTARSPWSATGRREPTTGHRPATSGPPADVKPMAEAALAKDMEAFIQAQPRSWKEILQHYHGQPYRPIYRAFSSLRHRLGRSPDAPWYRYTFSDQDFVSHSPRVKLANFDPRHR